MRPPDGLGRCPCGFPADQMLYGGLCIRCVNRCGTCNGSGQARRFNVKTGRLFDITCGGCGGTGRRAA